MMRQDDAYCHGDDSLRLVPDYLAGTLDAKRLAEFEVRLSEDAGLRATVEELRSLWDDLPDRAPAEAPYPLWQAVQTRLIQSRIRTYPGYQPRWRMAVSFAAGVLVGLSVWLLGMGGPSASRAAEEELLAQESIFESLDPIPRESLGGIYLALLPLEDQPPEEPQ